MGNNDRPTKQVDEDPRLSFKTVKKLMRQRLGETTSNEEVVVRINVDVL